MSVEKGPSRDLAIVDATSARANEIADQYVGKIDLSDEQREAYHKVAAEVARLSLDPDVHVALGSTHLDVSGLRSFHQALIPRGAAQNTPEGEVL